MTARVWPTPQVRPRLFGASVLISATLLFSSQLAVAQFSQQGSKPVYSYTTLNDPLKLSSFQSDARAGSGI
jgi:hypothetical protein